MLKISVKVYKNLHITNDLDLDMYCGELSPELHTF